MQLAGNPIAVLAADAPSRARQTSYPEPFAAPLEKRKKQPLGDIFGLRNFGVNLTTLAPHGISSLRHAHSKQDEFVYILRGHPTFRSDEGMTRLSPGMCAGFRAGTGNSHRLLNETDEDVVYLEVGNRTPGDEGIYPDDDLMARLVDGTWHFQHKNGIAW